MYSRTSLITWDRRICDFRGWEVGNNVFGMAECVLFIVPVCVLLVCLVVCVCACACGCMHACICLAHLLQWSSSAILSINSASVTRVGVGYHNRPHPNMVKANVNVPRKLRSFDCGRLC